MSEIINVDLESVPVTMWCILMHCVLRDNTLYVDQSIPLFLLHKLQCVNATPLQSSAPLCGGGGVIERSRRDKLQAPNVTVGTRFNKGTEHRWMSCRNTWNTMALISLTSLCKRG